MSKLEEYRARYPEYDDLDDETLMRKRHAKYYADMPYEEYRARFTGAAATSGTSPEGASRAGAQAAASGLDPFGRAVAGTPLRVIPQMIQEMGKDIGAGAQLLAKAGGTPASMLSGVVGERPETRTRGTAALVGAGLAPIGGPITSKLAGAGIKPLLARILGQGAGGAVAGGVDAGIRTGGDVPSMGYGGLLGGLLGGGVGALTRGRTPAQPRTSRMDDALARPYPMPRAEVETAKPAQPLNESLLGDDLRSLLRAREEARAKASRMSLDDLRRARHEEAARVAAMESEVLGENASRWRRAANKGEGDAVERELGLTQEQVSRLYGKGDATPATEDYDDLIRAHEAYGTGFYEGEPNEKIASDLARQLSRLDVKDPVAMLKMRLLAQRMAERGMNAEDAISSGARARASQFGENPQDLYELITGNMKQAREAARPAPPALPALLGRPAIQVPPPGPRPTARRSGFRIYEEGASGRNRGPFVPEPRRADIPEKPRSLLDRLLTGERKRDRAVQFFSPVNRRLQAFGEPGKRAERMLNDTIMETEGKPGPTAFKYREGGLGKLAPEENAALQDALEGYKPVESLNPKLRALYDAADEARNAQGDEAIRLGTKVMRGDKEVPFQKRQNYMAHHFDLEELAKSGSEGREAVLENMARNRGYETREIAEEALDDFLLWRKSNGRQGNDLMAQKMVEQGRAKSVAEAKGMLAMAGKKPSRERVNTLEMSRSMDVDFYDPRPSRVLPRDLQEKERGLAEIRNLGQRLKKAMAELEKIPDVREREEASDLLKAALKAYDEGDPAGKGLLGFFRQLNVTMFSPLTTLRNAVQGPTATWLTSDTPSFLRGLTKMPTKSGAKRSITSGAVGEGAIENVAQSIGASPRGLASKYLDVIGFRPVERWWNRHMGSNTGVEMALKWAKKYKKNPSDKFAASELRRLDLDPEKVLRGGLSEADLDRAALRHSQRGQLRSSPLDLPMEATRTEIGRSAAQFKTFDYQYGRTLYDETVGRLVAGKGDPRSPETRRALRNLGILATVYPVFGEVVNDAYAFVHRKDRDGTWKDALNPTKPRYWQNLGTAGATSVGGGIGSALAYGAGDRGGSVVKYLAGPSLGRVGEVLQTAYNINERQKKDPEWLKKHGRATPSQKRTIARLAGGGMGSIIGAQVFRSEEKDTTNTKKKSKPRKRKEQP